MKSALARLRQILPFLMGGVVITLFVAWGLPIMLAARGTGAWGEPMVRWMSARQGLDESDIPDSPVIELRRGVLSDWYSALPSSTDGAWPTAAAELVEHRYEYATTSIRRVPPSYVAVEPPAGEAARFARVDTGVAGWPFRAFRGESRYIADDNAMGHEVMPDLRGNWNLGLVNGQLLLVPHQPLWLGILGNIVFWSSLSWAVVAFPVAIRRRRREKYGKCGKCGYAMDVHAVKRLAVCPECGTSFRRDPLGFVHSPEMHFQNAYVWIIFVSSLDIMLTWKILSRGGIEVNPVAAVVIDAWGMHGAIAFKFALMMWVIVACEILARLKRSAGRFLSITAIVISASPVAWSLFLLVLHEFFPV